MITWFSNDRTYTHFVTIFSFAVIVLTGSVSVTMKDSSSPTEAGEASSSLASFSIDKAPSLFSNRVASSSRASKSASRKVQSELNFTKQKIIRESPDRSPTSDFLIPLFHVHLAGDGFAPQQEGDYRGN